MNTADKFSGMARSSAAILFSPKSSLPLESAPLSQGGEAAGKHHRSRWLLAVAGCFVLQLCLAEPASVTTSIGNENAPADAQRDTRPSVQVSIKAELLVRTGGGDAMPARDRFVPALKLKENDKVYYTLSIRNAGAVPANDIWVTQALPQNSVYLPNSANGPAADVLFSADGGRTFAAEKQLYVIDGANVRRRASPRDFTHIRLRLHYPLASQATALARYTVVFHG